jgi:hypothetical protein
MEKHYSSSCTLVNSMASHLGEGVEEMVESRNELWTVLLSSQAQGGNSLQTGRK